MEATDKGVANNQYATHYQAQKGLINNGNVDQDGDMIRGVDLGAFEVISRVFNKHTLMGYHIRDKFCGQKYYITHAEFERFCNTYKFKLEYTSNVLRNPNYIKSPPNKITSQQLCVYLNTVYRPKLGQLVALATARMNFTHFEVIHKIGLSEHMQPLLARLQKDHKKILPLLYKKNPNAEELYVLLVAIALVETQKLTFENFETLCTGKEGAIALRSQVERLSSNKQHKEDIVTSLRNTRFQALMRDTKAQYGRDWQVINKPGYISEQGVLYMQIDVTDTIKMRIHGIDNKYGIGFCDQSNISTHGKPDQFNLHGVCEASLKVLKELKMNRAARSRVIGKQGQSVVDTLLNIANGHKYENLKSDGYIDPVTEQQGNRKELGIPAKIQQQIQQYNKVYPEPNFKVGNYKFYAKLQARCCASVKVNLGTTLIIIEYNDRYGVLLQYPHGYSLATRMPEFPNFYTAILFSGTFIRTLRDPDRHYKHYPTLNDAYTAYTELDAQELYDKADQIINKRTGSPIKIALAKKREELASKFYKGK